MQTNAVGKRFWKGLVWGLILVAPFWVMVGWALATDYYVDDICATPGDGTSDTCAGAGTDPFQTVAAAQAAVTGDQSDNSLLFKKGGVWREQFTVGANGTDGHPFTIGAYGTGDDPVIKGSNLIGTWENTPGAASIDLDAEEGDISSLDGESTAGANTFIASEASKRSGTYGFHAEYDGTNTSGYGYYSWTPVNDLTITHYMMVPTSFTAAATFSWFHTFALMDGASVVAWVQLTAWNPATDWKLSVKRLLPSGGTETTLVDTGLVVKDQWYKIAIRWLTAASNGGIQVWIDDELKLTEMAADTSAVQPDTLRIGVYEVGGGDLQNAGSDLYFDDILSNDAGASNVWQAALTTNPREVFFDGVRGTEVATLAEVTSARKWFWAANVLYIYSTTDPDSAYTNPGIEATVRTYCIFADTKDYVTYENLQIIHGGFDGIRHENSSGIVLDGIAASWNGWDLLADNSGEGISLAGITGLTVQNSSSDNNGWNGFSVTRACTSVLIQSCSASGNYHQGFDFKTQDFHDASFGGDIEVGNMSGVVVINCLADSNINGFYFEDDTAGHLSNVSLFYSIASNNGYDGIWFKKDTGTEIDTVKLFNNVVYANGCTADPEWGIGIEAEITTGLIYNNIVLDNCGGYETPNEREVQINDGGGTANAMDYNIVMDGADTILYRWDGTARTLAEMKVASLETNSYGTDPLFTNAAGGDFTLLPTSPAIGKGTSVAGLHDTAGQTDYIGQVLTDVAGRWLTSLYGALPDIGAIEYRYSGITGFQPAYPGHGEGDFGVTGDPTTGPATDPGGAPF